MQFSEFVKYKECCPICKNFLSISLLSTRKYKFKYQEDKYVFSTFMKSLGKNKSTLDIDFVFNLQNASFSVNFYDKANKLIALYTPMSFIDSFKEFISNQKRLIFERRCTMCYQYKYQSKGITIDFNKSELGPLVIDSESICHYRKIDEENTRVFKIEYYTLSNTSLLAVKDITTDNLSKMAPFSGLNLEFKNEISCPYRLEMFGTKEQDLEKLETLITFS